MFKWFWTTFLLGAPGKSYSFQRNQHTWYPGCQRVFFLSRRGGKFFFLARHNRSIFAANNRRNPLASWISQVQNTDYYELPSITFLENSLDKSWNLENIMNLYVGWREGLGMNGSKKRNKWKFVSTPLVYDICSDRFERGKSITIALPGWGFMLDWALYIILPRSKA